MNPSSPPPSPPNCGALLVVGATSGAGKSTVVAALCRALAKRALRPAPFKAQNMSNHAAVTPDGGELGRAQATQALACGIDTDRRMNPILLKPGVDHDGRPTSHVVVLGEERGRVGAWDYGQVARGLRRDVLAALDGLRHDFDFVIAEGAGGAAEINLLDRDLVNLPLAAAAGIPAIVVVDIDRGGAFAHAYGTWAILPEQLRATIKGFVFNRFRGDPSLLEQGNAELERRTAVPVLGVLPHLGPEQLLAVEDSLDLDDAGVDSAPTPPPSSSRQRPVRVAVLRLPHLANPSDLDPLLIDPRAEVSWATRADQLRAADLIILPGSRATVTDLAWLRQRGLDRALIAAAGDAEGPYLLGLCAGYQMLGELIDDPLESGLGQLPGLGLLRVTTVFAEPKIVCRSRGWSRVTPDASGVQVSGYQIRFGRPVCDGTAWLTLDEGPEGCLSDDRRIRGSSLHGLLDADDFRAELLHEVARGRGFDLPVVEQVSYAAALDAQCDRLAEWVSTHLDLDAVLALAATARPAGTGTWPELTVSDLPQQELAQNELAQHNSGRDQ